MIRSPILINFYFHFSSFIFDFSYFYILILIFDLWFLQAWSLDFSSKVCFRELIDPIQWYTPQFWSILFSFFIFYLWFFIFWLWSLIFDLWFLILDISSKVCFSELIDPIQWYAPQFWSISNFDLKWVVSSKLGKRVWI